MLLGTKCIKLTYTHSIETEENRPSEEWNFNFVKCQKRNATTVKAETHSYELTCSHSHCEMHVTVGTI